MNSVRSSATGPQPTREVEEVIEKAKGFLVLVAVACFLGCMPSPTIDLLAPREGNPGDVIDIRDPISMSLGTEGTVYFGPVEATGIRKWTSSDIYVEVPDGVSGTVMVMVARAFQEGGGMRFVLPGVDLVPRVVTFGDSFAYWGASSLQIKLNEDPYLSQFHPLMINQGRRGEKITGADTLVRWQDALQFGDADFAVLIHGVNDLTDPLVPEDAVTLEEIEQGAIGLIEEILSTETTLILCTLPPRIAPCGDEQSPTTEEYNDWLRSYAAQAGIPLVDIYEDFVSTPNWGPLYLGGNCLHPIINGHLRIGELVTQKIVEIFLPTCTDLDTDGYGNPAAPPCPHPEPDCDDSNPDINPGILETPFRGDLYSDGLDNDCDGAIDLADEGCRECAGPEDCDDGLWCNGQETCEDYSCQEGLPPDCDDGVSCTEDACNEETDSCDNVANDGLCDDGNPCTNDHCGPPSGCENLCNAVGPEDPCCADPECTDSPVCDL